MKQCKSCEKLKSFDDFYESKSKTGKSYYSSKCKLCSTIKKYREIPTHKQCYTCHVDLPYEKFYLGKSYTGRFTPSKSCKVCTNLKNKIRYQNELRAIHENDPRKRMLQAAKQRAKRDNIQFTIELDDIVIPEFCPVFGIKLETSCGYHSDNSPTLDKIIPELGYVKGNVQVISHKANTMKSNANVEMLLKFSKWIQKQFLPNSYENFRSQSNS